MKVNPSRYVDVHKLEAKIEERVQVVQDYVNKYGDDLWFAWSMGKDSQALRLICDRAGVKNSYVLITDYEYPQVYDYVKREKPDNLLEFKLDYIDDEYILKHNLIFPRMSVPAERSRYLYHVLQKGHRLFAKTHKPKGVIFGRRTSENRFSKGPYYFNRDGYEAINPIYDFTDLEVLYIMVTYGYNFHPVYSFDMGFTLGTHMMFGISGFDNDEEALAFLKKHSEPSYYRMKELVDKYETINDL